MVVLIFTQEKGLRREQSRWRQSREMERESSPITLFELLDEAMSEAEPPLSLSVISANMFLVCLIHI